MSDGKIKVAVVGGGCASMAAVWELSKRPDRFDITVYQEGWRLGGKGASGRGGPSKRIEEHGLHVWLGFYDNAFRMMRECYAELAEAAASAPADSSEKQLFASFGDWREAFIPEDDVALFSMAEDGHFERWDAHMPPRDGLPGDPRPPGEPFTLSYYMARAFELFRALVLDTKVDDRGLLPDPRPGKGASVGSQIAYVGWLATFTTSAALAEALGVLATLLASVPDLPLLRRVLPAAEAVCEGLRRWLEDNWIARDHRRFVWEIADLTLATMVGLIREGVMIDERGLDAIDDVGCREWLARNGASMRSLQSPFLRGLFDLSMGYVAGDPEQPNLSAGQGLRGTLRTFFGYRGAFMWRMRAGMGDVVFAPLYVALKKRGVHFRFFRRLTNVGLSNPHEDGDNAHVKSLTFEVQAKTRDDEYSPFIEARGRPCWPSQPKWDLLVDGGKLKDRKFESHWDRPPETEKQTLRVGQDFDLVLLGVGLGAIPHVCGEILARDERWRDMTENVKTVASQAVQLWLKEDLHTLGWKSRAPIVGAFAKPFDTWCDMAHVVPEEEWSGTPPKTSVYLCAVLPDPADAAELSEPDYPQQRTQKVLDAARTFLESQAKEIWPNAYDKGKFRWDLLVASGAGSARGAKRLETQHFRANVNPSDRYVIHTPGSYRYRISPLDRTYDNFTIAGDWTDSGFHSGCVEGAVMSGLLAAHALSGSPKLMDIIAYDHP